MLFLDSVLFDMPSRKAQVVIENIFLSKVTFKNSYFLRDSSSGFINGE